MDKVHKILDEVTEKLEGLPGVGGDGRPVCSQAEGLQKTGRSGVYKVVFERQPRNGGSVATLRELVSETEELVRQ